jgi:23S rRNA (adenine2030-N6)-methyltransferase
VLDALKRFPTGTFAIWYPVIARPEAHAMAKKLKTLSTQHQRSWVQAELAVGHTPDGTPVKTGARPATQMRASGMHIINPPFTLAAQLREALPVVLSQLKGKVGSGWTVEHG